MKTLVLICMFFAAALTAEGGEFTRHTIWAEGSPFSPNVSVQYEYRFPFRYLGGIPWLRVGGAVGTLTEYYDNAQSNLPPEYKKTTFYAVPVSMGFGRDIADGEHFIELSANILCILSPTQFFYSDFGEDNLVRIAPGLSLGWRYEPDNTQISFKASGGFYAGIGYSGENYSQFSAWLGLGIGWRL